MRNLDSRRNNTGSHAEDSGGGERLTALANEPEREL